MMAKARQFVSWSCGVLVRHQPMSPLAASRPCPQPAAAGCVAADPQGLFAFASGRVARPFPSEGCASAQPEDRSPASAAGAGLSPAPRLRSVPAPPRLVADGHRRRVGAIIPPALRYLRVLLLDHAPEPSAAGWPWCGSSPATGRPGRTQATGGGSPSNWRTASRCSGYRHSEIQQRPVRIIQPIAARGRWPRRDARA